MSKLLALILAFFASYITPYSMEENFEKNYYYMDAQVVSVVEMDDANYWVTLSDGIHTEWVIMPEPFEEGAEVHTFVVKYCVIYFADAALFDEKLEDSEIFIG